MEIQPWKAPAESRTLQSTWPFPDWKIKTGWAREAVL